MDCLHPHCPLNADPKSWREVVDHPRLRIENRRKSAIVAALEAGFDRPPTMPAVASPWPGPKATVKRLLKLCPCLYNQMDISPSARAVAHFCELTMGERITSANVMRAFAIQHPDITATAYNPGPFGSQRNGGPIMEMLCSEILTNSGLPEIWADNGWPDWHMPGHVNLNFGAMKDLKSFGDLMVPCAPTNLLISVKSVSARERLLYSANSTEVVGFGFFDDPSEFWTELRMSLYKRFGFTAIYMPPETLEPVVQRIARDNLQNRAININGTQLYRSLVDFGPDMRRVVGKSSALL